jgi:phage-related protein
MPTSKEILESNFLEIRSRILELAAALDRIERAGSPEDLPLWKQIHQGLDHLQTGQKNRAERIQLLFSRPFEADWPSKLGVEIRKGC